MVEKEKKEGRNLLELVRREKKNFLLALVSLFLLPFFFFRTVCISFGYYMHILLPSIRSLPSKFPRRAYAILNCACNFNPPFHPPLCYPLEAAFAALLLSSLFLSVWNRNCSRLVAEGASCLRGPQGNTQAQLMPRDRNLTLCICATTSCRPIVQRKSRMNT